MTTEDLFPVAMLVKGPYFKVPSKADGIHF